MFCVIPGASRYYQRQKEQSYEITQHRDCGFRKPCSGRLGQEWECGFLHLGRLSQEIFLPCLVYFYHKTSGKIGTIKCILKYLDMNLEGV